MFSGEGSARKLGGAFEIRFERNLPHPVETIWAEIATAEGVANWLADARLDPVSGGAIELTFGGADEMTCGTIARYEPPRMLQYSWPVSGGIDAVIRWELAAKDEATRLTFVQTLEASAGVVADSLAAWHARLDRLEAQLAGIPVDRDESPDQHLRDHYLAVVTAAG